jgi:hypothetical protein
MIKRLARPLVEQEAVRLDPQAEIADARAVEAVGLILEDHLEGQIEGQNGAREGSPEPVSARVS